MKIKLKKEIGDYDKRFYVRAPRGKSIHEQNLIL